MLETRLGEFFCNRNVSLMSNGTLGLLIALKALDLKGEVITTPYSFVATAHSIVWNGLTPVFCDTDSTGFNIDPNRIEELITPRTVAIMPVHVYGIPCAVDAIKEIAERNKLKVIYDAAHAFGVRYKGKPVTDYGDISVLSFHATKVYNTVEGGAIVASNNAVKARIDLLRNFGFSGETSVDSIGINAKMNELLAAWGLLQLEKHDEEVAKRKTLFQLYQSLLSSFPDIQCLEIPANVEWNYSYFPILINIQPAGMRDTVYHALKVAGYWSRRYFFPLIVDFEAYGDMSDAVLPNARRVSENVLCLPMYGGLSRHAVIEICLIICNTLKSKA